MVILLLLGSGTVKYVSCECRRGSFIHTFMSQVSEHFLICVFRNIRPYGTVVSHHVSDGVIQWKKMYYLHLTVYRDLIT